jgi:hypothetical protein
MIVTMLNIQAQRFYYPAYTMLLTKVISGPKLFKTGEPFVSIEASR